MVALCSRVQSLEDVKGDTWYPKDQRARYHTISHRFVLRMAHFFSLVYGDDDICCQTQDGSCGHQASDQHESTLLYLKLVLEKLVQEADHAPVQDNKSCHGAKRNDTVDNQVLLVGLEDPLIIVEFVVCLHVVLNHTPRYRHRVEIVQEADYNRDGQNSIAEVR